MHLYPEENAVGIISKLFFISLSRKGKDVTQLLPEGDSLGFEPYCVPKNGIFFNFELSPSIPLIFDSRADQTYFICINEP